MNRFIDFMVDSYINHSENVYEINNKPLIKTFVDENPENILNVIVYVKEMDAHENHPMVDDMNDMFENIKDNVICIKNYSLTRPFGIIIHERNVLEEYQYNPEQWARMAEDNSLVRDIMNGTYIYTYKQEFYVKYQNCVFECREEEFRQGFGNPFRVTFVDCIGSDDE